MRWVDGGRWWRVSRMKGCFLVMEAVAACDALSINRHSPSSDHLPLMHAFDPQHSLTCNNPLGINSVLLHQSSDSHTLECRLCIIEFGIHGALQLFHLYHHCSSSTLLCSLLHSTIFAQDMPHETLPPRSQSRLSIFHLFVAMSLYIHQVFTVGGVFAGG